MPDYGSWSLFTRICKGVERVVVVIVTYVHAELLNRNIGYLLPPILGRCNERGQFVGSVEKVVVVS